MPLIDRIVKVLLPREDGFFDLLEKGAAIAETATQLMVRLCAAEATARPGILKEIVDVEHAADAVIHEVYDALNSTFVTPIDRSDIYALASQLEEIVDLNHATAMLLEVYAMEHLPAGANALAELAVTAASEAKSAVGKLRGLKRLDEIRVHCKKMSQLEHDGDNIYRKQMNMLFRSEQNAVRLIQHKEFLQGLEGVVDAIDHTGGVLSAIVIKNG